MQNRKDECEEYRILILGVTKGIFLLVTGGGGAQMGNMDSGLEEVEQRLEGGELRLGLGRTKIGRR